jgi:hypothetical protein
MGAGLARFFNGAATVGGGIDVAGEEQSARAS